MSKTTPRTTNDPQQLDAGEWRWFIYHTPNSVLKENKLERPSFVLVGLTLSQVCDYKSGTRVRLTQAAIADMTGLSVKTVRKVLNWLKLVGALEVVDHQRHPGKSSEVFRLRRSRLVADVLTLQDRHWKKPEEAGREPQPPQTGTTAPSRREPQPHNKKSINSSNHSVTDAPSLSPIGASPDGRASASRREDVEEVTGAYLNNLDLILADL